MKLLKYIVFLLMILVITGAIYVVTLDGSLDIKEKMTTRAPAGVGYKDIKNLDNWKNFQFWNREEDQYNIAVKENAEGGVKAFEWSSQDDFDAVLSNGKTIPNKEINQSLTLNTATGQTEVDLIWTFTPNDSGSQIQLEIAGELGFWTKAYQKTQRENLSQKLSEFFHTFLNALDQRLSEKISEYDIHIDGKIQRDGFYYLYETSSTRYSALAIKKTRTKLLKEVKAFMTESKTERNGPPILIYNQLDPKNNSAIISTGYPTMEDSETNGENILKAKFKPVNALKTTLKGDYSNLKKAWKEAEKALENTALSIDKSRERFEIYTKTWDDSTNPADWVTELYLPVKQNTED